MGELPGYAFLPLREGDFTHCRVSGDGLAPVLLVTAEDSSFGSVKRLEHEFALRAELDAAWAARPITLSRQNDRMTLALHDPGGEPLIRLLGRPMAVSLFLRIAVPLAVAVGEMHARGLIHKDLKPGNILVDTATGGVWLTGFGIASRLPREHQAAAPPAGIAGTLAYMAPEQTGRMNRTVDSRSDLYALGVTFYEMLTGALPFTAVEPMEWVHCHIARQPVPPQERVAGIPEPLAAIVIKLLAKTAEERYQTAAGLGIDLRHCLAQWETTGRIEPFPLGQQDASDRLLIPERLYGREREIDCLLAAFGRVVAHGSPELVLVSGYSGIGKSSIVNELQKALVLQHGLFASGKFDQYKRDIPYATLAQAFQSLVRPILAQNEAELVRWRSSLQEALGSNGGLISNLVPELELIVGKQPAVPDLSPQETQRRFQLVFRRFVAVFARQEHPLVLFLDDLQWLDAATLEVLENLITHPEVEHLLLVGAYRDNEVRPFDPLTRTLDEIRRSRARVCEIILTPLATDDVERLIGDCLRCDPEHARALSRLVQEKTGGNPFFVIQFISMLVEEGLIAFDRSKAAWTCDLARIQAKAFTDNVVDLMIDKLSRLPATDQDVLKLLACLGSSSETATLSTIQGQTEAAIESSMFQAVRAGLVFQLEGNYAFLHDRVQEAAYSLIQVDRRAALHLRIGRQLVAAMSSGKLAEQVFNVVNQFNHGAALITDPAELEWAAELNLRAGRKARASTAYASACRYFNAGLTLLGSFGWTRRFDLAFGLKLELAECLFLSSKFEEAERFIAKLLWRARSNIDKAAVYRLKIELHVVKSENPQAVGSALECLRLFGIDMPDHPSREEVHTEYAKIWRNLGDRSIESLIDLPRTTAPEANAVMRMLAALMDPAYYTDPDLFKLAVCQIVNLTLTHGMTDPCTHGLGWFGWILCYEFGRYDDGYRFGKLAVDFIEQRGFTDNAKVRLAMGVIVSWTKPVSTSIDFLRKAFRTGVDAGDVFFAASIAFDIVDRLILTGVNLDEVWRESDKFVDFARKIGFRDGADRLLLQQRFVAAMQGRTANLSTFDDAGFDELAFEADLTANRMPAMVCWYWNVKIGARFISGDYERALEAAEKAARLLWATPGMIHLVTYHTFSALTLASLFATTQQERQGDWRARIMSHLQQLQEWAKQTPENFESAAVLVAAELARIEHRDLEAMRLYEQAIRRAREQGFLPTEAIANELAARFYAAQGLATIAETYLRNARHCYLQWGAEGKVRQLERLHPDLRDRPPPKAATATFDAPIEQLEVRTVVKASQALSSEIDLGKLIEALMRIAIEHAGADRGMLVLLGGDGPRIQAEAASGRAGVEVRLRSAPVLPSELPESVLHYVIRTRQSVILGDAAAPTLFAADAYVQRRQPRSVLCMPLIKQTELAGALYLENSLTPHVFTAARIAILELVASQAAVSLENATLYSNLQQENAERKRAEQELRRSEAHSLEAQRLSRTGSFGWKVASGEIVWSEESFRIFGYDKIPTVSLDMVQQRVHPQDLDIVRATMVQASMDGEDHELGHRLLMPDGSVRHIHVVAHAVKDDAEGLEFIGAIMDVTAAKRAEEELHKAQAELAHVGRVTTLGELTASIAHEVNQPLTGLVSSGNACLRWLAAEPPNLDAARRSVERMIGDGTRAGEVISRIRALVRKSPPRRDCLDINDTIRDVIPLIRTEIQRHHISLQTEFASELPPVLGDRIQIQQVVLNLAMNAIEAMSRIGPGPRDLLITSTKHGSTGVLVTVLDSGMGLEGAALDRLFDAFYTTKPDGMGMGLAICRTIVEAHGGRLRAGPNVPQGARFEFTLPNDERQAP